MSTRRVYHRLVVVGTPRTPPGPPNPPGRPQETGRPRKPQDPVTEGHAGEKPGASGESGGSFSPEDPDPPRIERRARNQRNLLNRKQNRPGRAKPRLDPNGSRARGRHPNLIADLNGPADQRRYTRAGRSFRLGTPLGQELSARQSHRTVTADDCVKRESRILAGRINRRRPGQPGSR